MVTVEIVRLPSEIATMLMVRNREIIPLRWQTQPNRRGKNALDEMNDKRLFGDIPVYDDAMTAAVRSLLYLWNGWPDDAKMHAQPAPINERLYVTAFAERMVGRWDSAKELFAHVSAMPFLPTLLKCTHEITASSNHQLIQTLQQEWDEAGTWDHSLFSKLLQEAALGRLGLSGEQVVSQIQYKEFELLFGHCFDEATGTQVLIETRAQVGAGTGRVHKRETPKKAAASSRVRRSPSGSVVEAGSRSVSGDPVRGRSGTPAQQSPREDLSFQVTCPLCGALIQLPVSARGSKNKCSRCGGFFMVGGKTGGSETQSGAKSGSASVLVNCPVCKTTHKLPPSARGTNHRCVRCGQVFSVAAK